jgi:DNA-binding beta-propeller fold protein YncE
MKTITLLSLLAAFPAHAQDAPLALEAKIILGAVSGRIDHMAVDLGRRRLFVAELGNDSVGVVDLVNGTVLRRLTGPREPQGVGYLAATDTLYVASARDGSVSMFAGEGLTPSGRVELGDDADNIRIDAQAQRVYVGYGSGGIAALDARGALIAKLALADHPEGFQLDPRSARIYVNVPDEREIVVLDRVSNAQVAAWKPSGMRANFPMALDIARGRVLVAFRRPARLVAYGASDGAVAATVETCGDADDVFVDAKRDRVYVSCGDGLIDVFAPGDSGYLRLARIETNSGARTTLFVSEFDRLYLAVRARGREPAAIWVYRPQP